MNAEWQAIANNQDKMIKAKKAEMKKYCRDQYKRGGTVPYTLAEMIDLGLSLKIIRAITR